MAFLLQKKSFRAVFFSPMFLTLFFLHASGSAAENDGPGAEFYMQAMQHRSENRFKEAEDALLQALRYEPSNANYHFELSNIYAALYDAWQAKPNAPQAVELLSRSRHALEQTLVFSPDHIPAHFNLGVVYKRTGRYEEARDEFREVLELSPDLAAAWFQIGSIYQEQGFWDEAEDAYVRARELSYNPYEINETLNDLKIAREKSESAASRSLGTSGFGQQGGLDAFGGAQNLYGSVAGRANQSQNNTNMLPSMAAMMIQQMLSRNSQTDQTN